MVRGMYSAATGLQAYSQQQDVLAENVAQASTPGYRQKGTVYETFDRVLGRASHRRATSSNRVVGTYTDFTPGTLQHTGQPYDLALDHDSFFILDGPRGQIYTRNGSFHVNQQGLVVSQAGYPLQGTAGNIRVPASTINFQVATDGTVTADGNRVVQIQRARFTKPEQLVSVGPTLFRAPPGSGLQYSMRSVGPGLPRIIQCSACTGDDSDACGHAPPFDAAGRAMRAIAETIALNTKPQ